MQGKKFIEKLEKNIIVTKNFRGIVHFIAFTLNYIELFLQYTLSFHVGYFL